MLVDLCAVGSIWLKLVTSHHILTSLQGSGHVQKIRLISQMHCESELIPLWLYPSNVFVTTTFVDCFKKADVCRKLRWRVKEEIHQEKEIIIPQLPPDKTCLE